MTTSSKLLTSITQESRDELVDELMKPLVGIVGVSVGATSSDCVDFHESGVLVRIGDCLAVLTAGHVLTTIENLTSGGRRLIRFGIADRGPREPDNTHVPVRFDRCSRFKADADHYDLGAFVIPGFEGQSILRTDSIAVLELPAVAALDETFDAYFLLGFPLSARTEYRHDAGPKRSVRRELGIPLLPVTPIADVPDQLAAAHPRFVAHIDDVKSEHSLADIRGMSGGPIFGVRRDGMDAVVRLVAIQSSWLKGSRIIVADFAKPFLEYIEREIRIRTQAG